MIVAGLAVYLVVVGLDKADKVASSIGVIVAVIAGGAPYLLPAPPPDTKTVTDTDRVQDSGTAHATGGGQANTGLQGFDADRPAQVTGSGDATADGTGSVANTGIQHRPGP